MEIHVKYTCMYACIYVCMNVYMYYKTCAGIRGEGGIYIFFQQNDHFFALLFVHFWGKTGDL